VLGRLSQIRGDLPATAETEIERVTFSAFPIIGISLTSSNRDITSLWETANYELKPRFLQIPGVARVEITGGQAPEYHVVVDPLKLQAAGLGLSDVSDALTKNNLVAPAGMMEENYHLYLTTVDGRVRSAADIENLVIAARGGHPVQIKDVAHVERGAEPVFLSVTAQGRDAVLLNIQSQADGSTLDIAAALKKQLEQLRQELPPDMHLAIFLRPVAFRARFGGQRVGRNHLRPDPVGADPVFLPEKLGQRVDGHRHDSDLRADHLCGDEAGRT
jgi:multidrug efflux pump subunit AcrB